MLFSKAYCPGSVTHAVGKSVTYPLGIKCHPCGEHMPSAEPGLGGSLEASPYPPRLFGELFPLFAKDWGWLRTTRRQPNRNLQSRWFKVAADHGATAGFDARFHDRQAKPDSTGRAVARGVGAIKRIEEARQIARGHAGAAIGHPDLHRILLASRGNRDGAGLSGVTHGVAQQVRQGACQQFRVGAHPHVAGDFEFDLHFVRHFAADGFLDGVKDIDRTQLRRGRGQRGLGEREQLVDQTGNVRRFLLGAGDLVFVFFAGALIEDGEGNAQLGQGRS